VIGVMSAVKSGRNMSSKEAGKGVATTGGPGGAAGQETVSRTGGGNVPAGGGNVTGAGSGSGGGAAGEKDERGLLDFEVDDSKEIKLSISSAVIERLDH
jgi:hypothetical protein